MLTRRSVLALTAALSAVPAWAARPRGEAIVNRITVRGNRLWIAVTIGGKGPYPFIIDTGAQVSGINERLAGKLGLKRVGNQLIGGIGGTLYKDFYLANDVVFGGGVRQPSAVFGNFHAEGAGLLAAGLMTSFDSDLSFGNGEWRVYPGGRGERPGMSRLSSTISTADGPAAASSYIYVDAVLDGRKLRLLLDTGSPGEVMLFPQAARRSGLWNETKPYAPTQLAGIGGTVEAVGRTVRAGSLTLGPLTFDAPLVLLYDPHEVVDRNVDGLLGLAAVQRLDLSTDVRRRVLWAARNNLPKMPEIYRGTGLWLDRAANGRTIVASVSPGSPASEAGLKVGEIVVAANWPELRRALDGPPGTLVSMQVESPAGPVTRQLTTRAFL